MTPRLLPTILAVTATAFALAGPSLAEPPTAVAVGGTLRNLPMQGLTGPSALLADFSGKPLLINVWASYCPPCLAEMASIERLHRERGGNLQVIGISIDDYTDRAQRFLDRARTSFPHFIDQQLMLERMLGADRIPLTVLVDARGRVVRKVYGAREWDSAESRKLIDQAFAGR